MCKALDDMRKHSREEGKLEGKIETLLEFGLTIPEIAKRLKITEDEVIKATE